MAQVAGAANIGPVHIASDVNADKLQDKAISSTAATNNQILKYNSTSEQWEPSADAAGSDEQAKVSADDTTAGYLNGKLVAGSNITLTEGSPGGNETLTIASTGGGAVDSVFTRTGAVVAATNDYTWAQIDKSTSSIADITTKSHTSLTDKGTNTHAQIDTHIALLAKGHNVIQTLTDAATVAWDADSGNFSTVTLTANRAMGATTNQIAGGIYILIVKQDAGGTNTLSWNANYLFPGGTDPVLSTGGSAIDIFTFISDGTNMFCAGIQYNFS